MIVLEGDWWDWWFRVGVVWVVFEGMLGVVIGVCGGFGLRVVVKCVVWYRLMWVKNLGDIFW